MINKKLCINLIFSALMGAGSFSAIAANGSMQDPMSIDDPMNIDDPLMLNPEDLVIRIPANTYIPPVERVFLASGQMLPQATVGVPYSFDLREKLTILDEEGKDYDLVSWSLLMPPPAGLNLSSDGILSGTPIAPGANTFEIAVTYKRANDNQVFVMEVGLDITVSLAAGTPPIGVIGKPYAGFNARNLVTVIGDPSFNIDAVTWSLKAGSSLPEGLLLDEMTGQISGVPTALFDDAVTLIATYRGESGERSYEFKVDLDIVVSLATGSAPQGLVGKVYPGFDPRPLLSVTGDPGYDINAVSWSLSSGALPPGLVLDASTGVISGTPSAAANGTITLRATYKGKNGERGYSLVVLDIKVALAAATPPVGVVGAAYSFNVAPLLSVTGDSAFNKDAVTWSIKPGSSLPTGLTLNATTGLVSGTPTEAFSAPVSIMATYRGIDGERAYTFTVSLNIVVALATATPPTGVVGIAYAGFDPKAYLTVTGDAGFDANAVSWSVVSGALPAGLTLNVATGLVSGTPTTAGSATATLRATYKTASGERAYTFVTININVSLAAATAPEGIVGVAYPGFNLRNYLTVTGDASFTSSTPVAWSVVSGTLPAGLSLNTSTGMVSGTPTAAASNSVTFRATYKGKYGDRAYSLVTLNIGISLAAATAPEGIVGLVYSGFNLRSHLTITGDPAFTSSTPIAWSIASGALPAGLTLNASTGVISGTPTTASSNTVTFRATYKGKSGERAYSLIVKTLQMQFSIQPHGTIQTGQAGTAVHTLTNPTGATVTLGTQSVSGTGFSYLSKTCGTTLAAGASCTITTRCLSSTAGNYTGTISVPVSGVSTSGALSCTVTAPMLTVSPAGVNATVVGGWSNPINWHTIRNDGVGPVTLTSFTAANASWTLLREVGNAYHCQTSQTLQPGQQCQIGEQLAQANPGANGQAQFTGTHTISTSVGNRTIESNMAVRGVTIVGVTPITQNQHSGTVIGEYRITNASPDALTSMSITVSGTGFTLDSTTCGTTLAAAASCTAKMKHVAGTTGTTATGNLFVSGGYAQRINNIPGAVVRTGEQGRLTQTLSIVAPNVTLTPGTFSALLIGQSANVTHVLKNSGVLPINITGAPTLSASAHHSYVSTTCSGSLAAGASCNVVTKFAPSSTSSLSATLTVPTNIGNRTATLAGKVVPQSDASVTVTSSPAAIATGGKTTYTITVKNGTGGPATINASFNAAASGGASITTRATPTCTAPSGSTCNSVSTTSATLTLAASATITIKQEITAGGAPGTITMPASITVSGVQDTNTTNNSASSAVTVSYPVADMGVTLSLTKTSIPSGSALTGTVTVRNNTTTTNTLRAPAGNATVSVSGAGAGPITLTSVTCGTVSSGATCNTNGAVSIPPGGSVVYNVKFSVGSTLGANTVSASVALSGTGISDPVSTNNSTSTATTVRQGIWKKACYFTSDKSLTAAQVNTLNNGWNLAHAWIRAYVADFNAACNIKNYQESTGQKTGITHCYTIKGTSEPFIPAIGVVWHSSPSTGGMSGFGTYWGGGACFMSDNPSSSCLMDGGIALQRNASNQRYAGRDVNVPQHSMAKPLYNPGADPANTYYSMWMELTPAYSCQAPGSTTYSRQGPY